MSARHRGDARYRRVLSKSKKLELRSVRDQRCWATHRWRSRRRTAFVMRGFRAGAFRRGHERLRRSHRKRNRQQPKKMQRFDGLALNHRAVDLYLTTLATDSVDQAEPLEVVGRGRPISG